METQTYVREIASLRLTDAEGAGGTRRAIAAAERGLLLESARRMGK